MVPFFRVTTAVLAEAGRHVAPLPPAPAPSVGRARPVRAAMAPALTLSPQTPHVDLRIDGGGGGLAGFVEVFGAYVGPGAADPSTVHLRIPELPAGPEPPSAASVLRAGLHVRLACTRPVADRPLLVLVHARGDPRIAVHGFCGQAALGVSPLREDGPKVVWIDPPGAAWDADLYFLGEGPPGAPWSVAGVEIHVA